MRYGELDLFGADGAKESERGDITTNSIESSFSAMRRAYRFAAPQ